MSRPGWKNVCLDFPARLTLVRECECICVMFASFIFRKSGEKRGSAVIIVGGRMREITSRFRV